MPWYSPDNTTPARRVGSGLTDLPEAPTHGHRVVRALVSVLGLVGLLSCGPAPVSTQNPSTLWVNYGQTELDLILVESEPPYY